MYRKLEPIDDPIVAVSLDLNEKTTSSNRPRKSVTPVISNKQSTKDSAPTKTATEEKTESSNEVSARGAYDAGNVSVKPKVMKSFQISYPQQAKEARVEGAVHLSVVVDEQGQVDEVKVLNGPGYGLNDAAKEALKKFIFSPAEKEGQKVPVRLVYIYRFKLESR